MADYTHHAVPAVLTGKRPASDNLPVAADHPDNLFRLLRGRYRVNAMESSTDLCTPAVCVQQIGIALCPAWGFRRGANRVELFALSGRGRSVRLARLQISR